MSANKLVSGQELPAITVKKLGGGDVNVFTPAEGFDWRMLIVYRGKHCPICTQYLSTLNELNAEFNALGIDVVAASSDPEEKAIAQTTDLNLSYEIGYGMSIEQMQTLGLYISNPRSPEETDRPFAEPALIVANSENCAQIVDISNAPFARPELKTILMGLTFIRNPENNYPIRGTYA